MNLEIGRLHLDPQNPRLPEEVQGRNENELLEHLYENFDLDEIASPMAENGYFDEEPLVVVPIGLPGRITPDPGVPVPPEYERFIKQAEFTVVEGNRRLATARILLDDTLRRRLRARQWPIISEVVRADLEKLPAIIYSTRNEVLPYLGIRHITGNKKWDSYAKARYIASMITEGHSVEVIEREVGDRSQAVVKNAIAYNTLQQARREFDWDLTRAKEDFSYMLLAIGQRDIKNFLGWTKEGRGGKSVSLPLSEVDLESPVPDDRLDNLRDFLSWIYGDGKQVLPVIKESRDITNFLGKVMASENAVEYLRRSRDLKEAFDLTDGEEIMVRKLIRLANTKLEKALGVVHRHKTDDVIAEAQKCSDTAEQVLETVLD